MKLQLQSLGNTCKIIGIYSRAYEELLDYGKGIKSWIEKYNNTLCLSPQTLHKPCFQFLSGLTMVLRGNKNSAYAKFVGTNKAYYGIFRSGLFGTTEDRGNRALLERYSATSQALLPTGLIIIPLTAFKMRMAHAQLLTSLCWKFLCTIWLLEQFKLIMKQS